VTIARFEDNLDDEQTASARSFTGTESKASAWRQIQPQDEIASATSGEAVI